MLGHLSFKPSSQRMYNSSAIGLRFMLVAEVGDAGRSVGALVVVEGPSSISSVSVTTSPRLVSSLFRVTRLCGRRLRDVATCSRTTSFLR